MIQLIARLALGAGSAALFAVALLAGCGDSGISGERSADGADLTLGGKCQYEEKWLGLAFTTYRGETSVCDSNKMYEYYQSVTVEGVVIAHDDAGLTIDSCTLDADCAEPLVSTFSVSAPGLVTHIPAGAFVRVEVYESGQNWTGCTGAIRIDNLPMWSGAQNPKDGRDHTWLFAKDGALEGGLGSVIAVESLLVCGTDPQIHDLRFTSSGGSVTLSSGETAALGAAGAVYRVHNIRCVEYCCHGGPCGYWMARAPD